MFFTDFLSAIGKVFVTILGGGSKALVNTAASSPAVQKLTTPAPITKTAPKVQPDYLAQAALVDTFYPRDVVTVARALQNRYPRLNRIDARWLGCQAVVESGEVNNPLLSLSTTRSHRDADGIASYGLMQVRTTTATDMYDRAGFTDYGRPDIDLLNISTANIYFSLAVHADNYERYVKNNAGRVPTLQWQIQAYNGGYGNGRGGASAAGQRVLAYYNKVITVKNKIWNYLT